MFFSNVFNIRPWRAAAPGREDAALLGLWRARQGRKAAAAIIAPFVERSRHRLGDTIEIHWLDPYLVGFMSTLITLVATRRTGGLGSEVLGLVQSEAWAEITGLEAALVGEQICFLSATGHRGFIQGCRNAATFDQVASNSADLTGYAGNPQAAPYYEAASGHENDGTTAEVGHSAGALWIVYFDDHLH